MNESNNELENSRAKKIRRILLLKTNQELKARNKKDINIKINSKTLQELNKAYNPYQILLSEASPIYSNYVQIIEEIFPNTSEKDKKLRHTPKINKIEQPTGYLDSSFDSHGPDIDYIPKKLDLGYKKLKLSKKDFIKDTNSPQILDEIKISECKPKEEKQIEFESTKLENKAIDKNVNIKLQTNIEENDENRKKNAATLRKYCNKLIKRRKKVRNHTKQKQSLSPKKPLKYKGKEKIKYNKRRTVINSNEFIKNTLLIGIKENKEINTENIPTREDTNVKPNINKVLIESEKNSYKNKIEIHDRIPQKLNSFKILKLKGDNEKDKEKEKINTDKKRKIRRVQTLNIKNPNSYLSKLNHKKEAKKIHSTIKQNQTKKDLLISTKLARPSKFIIINNNISNTHLFVKKDHIIKNSLFGPKRKEFSAQKLKFIKEGDKERFGGFKKTTQRKQVKHTEKLFSQEYKNF